MYSAVIVAAGSAKRTELGYNKIFYKINDMTILEYTLNLFIKDSDFKEIIVVLSKDDIAQARAMLSDSKIKYVLGGSTRQKSVFNGLSLVNEDRVFIHDGARPNLKRDHLSKLKQVSRNSNAVVLYSKVKDSVVEYSDGKINEYLDRESIGLVQTPQVFNSKLIKKAHSLAINNKNCYTDDASLFRKELNEKITLVEGDEFNIKATTKFDLILLEELL